MFVGGVMNKTKIDWCDWSWNPETGCLYGCWYCFAKKLFTRFKKSFEPTFYPERLDEPKERKPPTERNNKTRKPWIVKAFPDNWLIFCCSVSDYFADWTKPEWRKAILKTIRECPQHIFQLLTKQPQNINMEPMKNVWVGATITCNDEMDKLYSLVNNYKGMKFISFEPLLDAIEFTQNDGYIEKIDWIIIGKLTGSKKVKLERRWVEHIIREARARGIPIFIKDNVGWHEKIQEFPEV